MRIGMLVDMYKPNISGITSYVTLNKRWLEARGHKVFVYTFGNLDYEDDELYVMRSPGLPLNVNDSGFQLSFRYNTVAERKLRTMDVVHVHHAYLSGPLALRYCKPAGIPVVFTNHTRFDLYFQHWLPMVPEAIGETFVRTFIPQLCHRCDLVIAPSPGVAVVMRDLGVKDAIKVIPNGIDFAPYDHPPRVSRADVGLPEGGVMAMYVGRLSPEKNLSFLMRAFMGVAAACEDAHLLIIGGGPEQEDLEEMISHSPYRDRVHFLGKIQPDQVPSYLLLADLFVTASNTEVHPFSLIEAMASGLPSLGIDSPGIGDTITNEVDGLLTADHDLPGFTAAFTRLVLDRELRLRLGAAAKTSARRFDIEQTAPAVLAEYEKLAVTVEQRLTWWQRFKRWWTRPILGAEE